MHLMLRNTLLGVDQTQRTKRVHLGAIGVVSEEPVWQMHNFQGLFYAY